MDTSEESEGIDGDYIIDPLTEKTVGYKLKDVRDNAEKQINYKQVGMSWRFVFWSIPKYISNSVLSLNPIHLLGVPFMWVNGVLYKKSFTHPTYDNYMRGHTSEKNVGLYVGVVDSLLIIISVLILLVM
jgi:hypothetical protein